MPTPVILPTLGPAIEEAILLKWLVPVGGFVRRGDPLFSVETDKTLTDIESTDEGYLIRLDAEEGTTIRVDQVIGMLGEQPAPGDSAPASTPAKTPAEPAGASAAAKVPADAARQDEFGAVASPEAVTPGDEAAMSVANPERAGPGRPHASPRARRLAREAGLAIEAVQQGSGPGGRIVERDIAVFVAQAVAGQTVAANGSPAVRRTGQSHEVPLSPVRRSIARRMTESAQAAPVFFATVKVHADPLTALRAQLARARSIQASVNDIVVRACALALQQHRDINASFTGESIRMFDDIDISVAVAIEHGLITPIVRNADQKPLPAIATEIRALAAKAQSGQLAPHEYQGGTFTVSNLGMFGIESFTAILNPPQAAILAVGTIGTELHLEAGAPRERAVMRLTLTADHRAIDGAQAARFLATLKSLLESPAVLLL